MPRSSNQANVAGITLVFIFFSLFIQTTTLTNKTKEKNAKENFVLYHFLFDTSIHFTSIRATKCFTLHIFFSVTTFSNPHNYDTNMPAHTLSYNNIFLCQSGVCTTQTPLQKRQIMLQLFLSLPARKNFIKSQNSRHRFSPLSGDRL